MDWTCCAGWCGVGKDFKILSGRDAMSTIRGSVNVLHVRLSEGGGDSSVEGESQRYVDGLDGPHQISSRM